MVNENASTGHWPRTEPSYDVVWDDGTCSRRVARGILEGSWRFLAEPRRTVEECRARWFDFAIALSKQLEARHARSRAPAAQVGPLPVHVVAAAEHGAAVAHKERTPVPTARLVREAAKTLLADQFPGVEFAVHCERRVLHVTWTDGPLAGSVWKRLAALVDDRAVAAVRTDRALSETLVQAALNYCLWKVCPDTEERARLAMRASAQSYLDGGLDAVRASSGPASGLSFQNLVRCALERWDDCAQVFRNTKRTQGLVGELGALFHDDGVAASQFRTFRAASAALSQRTRDALSQIASGHLQRERP